MIITNYQHALDYLHKSIPKGKLRYPGTLGLDRQKYLLKCIGDPQNKYPVIHIAGTSGKGSTASYLSFLLKNHGFKVGLTVSPHIFDIRERIQINNKNISQSNFVNLLNKIIPAIDKTINNNYGNPTYFEIMVAMFFLAFYQHKVDYAVVETGMGGLMDGTNVVDSENKLVVITKLGFDHTRILGNTIAKIASQKAGIIHQKNTVLSLWQTKSARNIINKVVTDNHSKLYYIQSNVNYKNIHLATNGLTYNYNFDGLIINKIFINTQALYQIENSALALSVLKIISNRDHFNLKQDIILHTFSNFEFLGRMDVFRINDTSTVIFDGAHNPQKMSGFIKSLKYFYPNQKFIFVVAFKQKKEAKKMLRSITTIASQIILTSFVVDDQDMIAVTQTISDLVLILKQLKFNKYIIINNPESAIKTATNESNLVAVTGSLYLLSKVYPQVRRLQ
ncbi:MAG: Mur ligase family protein [Candidatus Shapirobacteria bacterium]